MIFFYYKVYTSALEQASLSVKIGYEMLIGIYAVICYATNLAIIWLFRQWKTEQEEDRQRDTEAQENWEKIAKDNDFKDVVKQAIIDVFIEHDRSI